MTPTAPTSALTDTRAALLRVAYTTPTRNTAGSAPQATPHLPHSPRATPRPPNRPL